MKRGARHDVAAVLVFGLFLGAVVAAGVWFAPVAMQSATKTPPDASGAPAGGAGSIGARSGRIVLGEDRKCRSMVFDNDTGKMRDDGAGCRDGAPKSGLMNFNSVRDGFNSR